MAGKGLIEAHNGQLRASPKCGTWRDLSFHCAGSSGRRSVSGMPLRTQDISVGSEGADIQVRTKHICAGCSDGRLTKARQVGDASAERLARLSQEPAWTRISIRDERVGRSRNLLTERTATFNRLYVVFVSMGRLPNRIRT